MLQYSNRIISPSSWNDAAHNALLQFLPAFHGQYVCKSFPISHYMPMLEHSSDVKGRLARLRKSVNKLIACQFDENGSVLAEESSSDEVVSAWRMVGFYGREFGALACADPLFSSETVAGRVHEILVRKQMDYGHENIRRFGRIGLIVRIQDKTARLENLVAKGAEDDPQNESLLDNVVDVMGYSAIGLMWEAGTFLFPLEQPVSA